MTDGQASSDPHPRRASLETVGITIGNDKTVVGADIDIRNEPELADLMSVFRDVLIAGMAAGHIEDAEIQGGKFLFLRRACWEGAIVAYARCFSRGQSVVPGRSRPTLAEYLYGMPPELLRAHAEVLKLRDKRIGHHVAGQSEDSIRLYYGMASPAGRLPVEVDVIAKVETQLYDLTLLRQVQKLTEVLRERVGHRIDELRQRALSRTRADVP